MRIILLGAILLLAACGGGSGSTEEASDATGSGGTRDFAVPTFTAITLAGAHDVIVTQGQDRSVRAEGDPKTLDRLMIRVRDGQLWIGERRGNEFGLRRRGKAVIYVTVPTLTRASIGGSGDLKIDKAEGESFAGSIGGSGDLQIDALRTRQAEFSIAGSGSIKVAGSTDETHVSIAGSGSVDSGALESRNAVLSIAGSGSATARASASATVSILGSGNARVEGKAKCTVSKLGSGTVTCGA